MNYQALARRCRPRDFASLVGQDHIVKALSHSLDTKKLHHAYLFSGTRGVGKTTLARIFAKALNCEKGITSCPCNQCAACMQIDTTSFIDYIELDAASNRGVEEMTTLLERVKYVPVNARFKIYMIDEVHMLSNHAFNAMLKTLEEPPKFVKFILATTEPSKIPITILSRCLQFNLKSIPEESIVQYLKKTLVSEAIKFENHALYLIARASDGSMRDALSILDHAIAFSVGEISCEHVREMLGLVSHDVPIKLLEALHKHDGRAIFEISEQILLSNMSFYQALESVSRLLHRLAWLQIYPDIKISSDIDQSSISHLIEFFTPEEVQLFYKISLSAKNELPFSPDDFSGFTMAFLRMLAFRPQFHSYVEDISLGQHNMPNSKILSCGNDIKKKEVEAQSDTFVNIRVNPLASIDYEKSQHVVFQNVKNELSYDQGDIDDSQKDNLINIEKPLEKKYIKKTIDSLCSSQNTQDPVRVDQVSYVDSCQHKKENDYMIFSDWPKLAIALPLKGLVRELALQSECISYDEEHVSLVVSVPSLATTILLKKLEKSLQTYLGRPVRLSVSIGEAHDTANFRAQNCNKNHLEQARRAMLSEPMVSMLIENFDGRIVNFDVHKKN